LRPNYKLNLLQKINSKIFDEKNIKKDNNDYNEILSEIRKFFIERVYSKDKFFGEIFSKTQIFINYIGELYN